MRSLKPQPQHYFIFNWNVTLARTPYRRMRVCRTHFHRVGQEHARGAECWFFLVYQVSARQFGCIDDGHNWSYLICAVAKEVAERHVRHARYG